MPDEQTPRFRAQGRRPPWWPENETWPPSRKHWGGWHWRSGRRRLFWRFGCLGGLVIFTGLMVFSLLVILAANALGLIQISGSLGWIVPLGGLILLLGFGMAIWAGRSLRRLSLPLGDLIESAESIAKGDYSRRVVERGPSEIRSLLRTFNHMAERLEASTKERQNLMADVTHELRTPLTIIQGKLEGMIDGVYPADESQLKAVLEETQLLDRLVEDLRILALAEGGALQLYKEPVDLATLIGESVAAFQSQAAAEGINLSFDADQEEGQFEVDGERIRQVLSNLLVNALRFTPEGGFIQVSSKTMKNEGEGWAQIEVLDSGGGIPAQDLAHIFERFFKGSDSRGMGLGLPIAKMLVEAHGGNIAVKSQPAQGTVFTIRLPYSSPRY
jgi:two-component system, OmpR family, sensor histidine kinase BaeS